MLLHVSDMTDRSDSNTYSDTGHTDRAMILVVKHAGGKPTSPEKEQKNEWYAGKDVRHVRNFV